MEKLKKAKLITPLDIAKFTGTEKEYNDALFEEEMKKNYEIIMSNNFEEEKNNIISENNNT